MTAISTEQVPPGSADFAVPRPEYPRPDLDRSARWMTLNGRWQFAADGVDATEITVPFAWETEASGVARTWLEHATYRRTVSIPPEWAETRVVLCFGAVHHHAIVRVDGVVIGEHRGGYEYFEVDMGAAEGYGGPIEIEIEVHAPADKREIAHGKQRSIPRDDYDGVSFTPTSGIWQSVWLEARGRTYPSAVSVRGDSLSGFDLEVSLTGDVPAGATVHARVIGQNTGIDVIADAGGRARGRLEIRGPRLWSPQDPYLYRIEVVTGSGQQADCVVVTAGMRKIETRGEHLLLTGERLYVRGVLDQGYWPETGLTAPDEASLRRDIRLAREMGYNLVRKHLKFEEPLWLHEADRTGMLVWAEPACPSRYTAEAANAFEAQLPAMVDRDGNHPSIIIWGLYNEEWGLDWDIPGSTARAAAATHAYETLKALDPTRPIVENSGWSHVRSDLVDWHYYEPDLGRWADMLTDLAAGTRDDFPVRLGPDFIVDKSLYGSAEFPRSGRPLLNSEYGEGFTSLERAWHLRWETQELRRHDRFAGYVYTEFADVEHEFAGLLTADRRRKDSGGCITSDVNAETTFVLDLNPLCAGADIRVPMEPFDLVARISHHGSEPVSGHILASWVPAGTSVDTVLEHVDAGAPKVTADPFTLSDGRTLKIPPVDSPSRLLLRFVDGVGRLRARTFIDASEVEPPNRRGARTPAEILSGRA